MKGISNSFLRTICALIIGLVLVMFPNEAGDYFVITIGVVFLIPALLSIIGYFAMSAEERRRLPIEGIGSLLFGLWLIIMPGFFADLLTFVLGFILVLGGVQQIASLSAARRIEQGNQPCNQNEHRNDIKSHTNRHPTTGCRKRCNLLHTTQYKDAGSCGILYHSGAHSDCRAGCLVQSDGGTFHGIYHYRYHQHSVCSFRIDKLVYIYSQTAEAGYAGSFFKGCRQY